MRNTTELAAEAMRTGPAEARVARAALFERVLVRIERYFRRMIVDPQAAEDCAQRTLLLLEQTLRDGRYDPERSFNAWMWLKARTIYAQHCRERERAPHLVGSEADLPPREDADLVRAEQVMDARAMLEAVRARLGDEAYEAFVLYYEGGLTQAEVAQALERDLKTVRKRIAQAHELIERLSGP